MVDCAHAAGELLYTYNMYNGARWKESWPHGNRASPKSHAINRIKMKMAKKKRKRIYYKNLSRVYFSSRTRSRVNLPIYFVNRLYYYYHRYLL